MLFSFRSSNALLLFTEQSDRRTAIQAQIGNLLTPHQLPSPPPLARTYLVNMAIAAQSIASSPAAPVRAKQVSRVVRGTREGRTCDGC